MPYVAHVGIKLKDDHSHFEKNKWYYIKKVEKIEYRWRLENALIYEVVAGVFDDKYDALKCAKSIYVTLLYFLMKKRIKIANAGCDFHEMYSENSEKNKSIEAYNNEQFFFWNKKNQGGWIGPGVYEVEKELDEFDEYKQLYGTISAFYPDTDLAFNNVDEYMFTYSPKSQELLSTIVAADSINDTGMKMTMYCGLLEHLAEDGKKTAEVISEIDALIAHVEDSDLEINQKNQLRNYLNQGKDISSRQKCIKLIEKYACTQYGIYTAKKVFNEAYSLRSTFSHGSSIDEFSVKAARYMKYLVLDVVQKYMIEKEREKECQNKQQR